MDRNRKRLYRWISEHPDRRHSLLPQNLPDDILQMLVEDTRGLHSDGDKTAVRAGENISIATMIMKSLVEDRQNLRFREEELSHSIINYAKALHLEYFKRKNVLEYRPDISLENVLSDEDFHYELTDYGRSLDPREIRL